MANMRTILESQPSPSTTTRLVRHRPEGWKWWWRGFQAFVSSKSDSQSVIYDF